MNNASFGNSVLSLFTLIDGKSLSYCYSNREIPSLLIEFQMLFRSKLISYIKNHDDSSRRFLDLCIDHIQDILNEMFDFVAYIKHNIANLSNN